MNSSELLKGVLDSLNVMTQEEFLELLEASYPSLYEDLDLEVELANLGSEYAEPNAENRGCRS